MINSTIIKLIDNIELHIVNFGDYNYSYKMLLDKYLTYLCEGTQNVEKLDLVKEKLRRYLKGKSKDPTKVAGWLAELFSHIYLTEKKYIPAFLFQNLEEQNSMKKGFDGFYIQKGDFFLYESKSNLPNELSKCHSDGLKVAYRDLKNKVEGKSLNKQKDPIDPWSSAIHHYKLANVKTDKTLLKQLEDIENNFYKNQFLKITECNIIPSSTIYLEDKYNEINKEDLKEKISKNLSYYNAKKNVLLCINKKTFNYIQNYLNE